MNPHRLTWGFMYDFPVAQVVGLVFILGYAFSKEPKKVPVSQPIVWLFLFYLWMVMTYLVHDKTPFATGLAIKIFKIQLFTLFIFALLNSKERIDQALWVIAYSLGFYGFKGGIFTIMTGGSFRVWGPIGTYIEGNNELGLALLIVIPIFFYLNTVTENKWLKRMNYLMIVLCAISVLGTHSRGALLASMSCAVFLWLKSKKKISLGILLAFLIPLGLSFMPQHWWDRMDTIFEEREEDYDLSVQGRLNAWRFAYNIASDKVFGGGFSATNKANWLLYAPRQDLFVDSHSIYFQIMGKHGFPGLFLYIMVWLSTWLLGSKIIKMVKHRQDLQWAGSLSRMLQVSIIAFCTGGTFLGLAYFDLPYHILITMAATYAVVQKELKKHPEVGVSNVSGHRPVRLEANVRQG